MYGRAIALARSARPELVGLACSLAVATAFEPFAWAAAMPIGLMALGLMARTASLAEAVRSATMFGFGFLGSLSWWLVESVAKLRGASTPPTHEDLVSMCQDIIAAQLAEIDQMQTWLCQWYDRCGGRLTETA